MTEIAERAPRFVGKAAIVTGGASGLGRETLLGIVAEGGSVVAVDVDVDRGRRVLDAASSLPGTAILHTGDLTEEQTIVDAIDRCVQEFGGLDIIHNNAGWQAEVPIHETSNEAWNHMVELNMTAVFWGCKHAIKQMLESGGGSIINTGSTLSFTADAMIPAYGATKAGVVGLTRGVALAYIEQGIRCNAICPGDMDTPLSQRYFESTPDPAATRREAESLSPIKRLADPHEIASAVLYLASDEASFVNGAAFVVDGGLTIKTY